MGNGDVTMSVGYGENGLRYYLSKNDFWRLRSKADHLSGPRVVGYLDIHIEGLDHADFAAEQMIRNGVTICHLRKGDRKVVVKSWVSATENLIFIECSTTHQMTPLSVSLSAPDNKQAALKTGKTNNIYWLTRAFADSVDIPTEVAVALRILHRRDDTIRVVPGKKLLMVLAVESRFQKAQPLSYVLNRVKELDDNSIIKLKQDHDHWWDGYWRKSSVTMEDMVLMKAYYQGLYTMAACSRDPKFPPGIFGWTTTDRPAWNGDYHLNYNFEAPFYG